MTTKDAVRMANSVDPGQTAPWAYLLDYGTPGPKRQLRIYPFILYNCQIVTTITNYAVIHLICALGQLISVGHGEAMLHAISPIMS